MSLPGEKGGRDSHKCTLNGRPVLEAKARASLKRREPQSLKVSIHTLVPSEIQGFLVGLCAERGAC
eukprot:11373710-Prorocentrum_lima.AAC.1